MGGSQHLGCPPGVVVVEVLGDDGAASDEVVVGVEDEASPGELSRAGLSVADAWDWVGVVPHPALLLAEHLRLRAALPPHSSTAAPAGQTTAEPRSEQNSYEV